MSARIAFASVVAAATLFVAGSAMAQPANGGARPWGNGGRGTTTTQPGTGTSSTSTDPRGGVNGGGTSTGPFGGGTDGGLNGTPNGNSGGANTDGRGGPFTPGVDGPAGPYTPGTIDTERTEGPFSPREGKKDGWSLWGGVKSFFGGVIGVIRDVSEIIYTLDAIRNVADWFGGLFHRSKGEAATATLPTNGFGNNTSRNAPTAVGGANTPVVVRTALDSPVVVGSPSVLSGNRDAGTETTSAGTPRNVGGARVSRTLTP